MSAKSLREFIRSAKDGDSYWVEKAKFTFAQELVRLLSESGMNNAEFAKKAGVKAPYISRVLRGDENVTIATMVKLARALDSRVHVHVGRSDCKVRWFDVATNSSRREHGSTLYHDALQEWSKKAYTAVVRGPEQSAANDHEAESIAA